MIWDKKFAINIVYDCYSGEKITRNQIKAFERFCDNLQWLENAKNEFLKYCKNDVNNDFNNLKKDNIFSYIKPESIFIKRDDINCRVALMCKYRYDQEHGLAIVFDKNGNITIGIQDIII